MEGKVELSIERYEELTKIERETAKKIDEIKHNIDKFVFDDRSYGNHKYDYLTRFIGKDAAIGEIQERNESLLRAIAKRHEETEEAEMEKKQMEHAIKYSSFRKRLKYLFTGNFDESSK